MNADEQAEREEFLRNATRAMGQRQMILAILDLPRDIKDLELQEWLGKWSAAETKLREAARTVFTSAITNVETAGRTMHVQATHLDALRGALALADSARKPRT